jgi:hypothetical protein
MTRLLILSDRKANQSDDIAQAFRASAAQAPPSIGERLAAYREGATWHAGRNIQALRSEKLPLCGWTRTWAQAVSLHQSARWATATGLRTQRYVCAGRELDRESSQDTGDAQRDLRDQCRTPAPTRGPGVDRGGSSARQSRPCRSGRDRRGYDCILSRRWRLAVKRGGRQ